MVSRTYKVADIAFRIKTDLPEPKAYGPFATEDQVTPAFTLEVVSDADVEGMFSGLEKVGRFNDEAPYIWIYRGAAGEGIDNYRIGFSLSPLRPFSYLEMSLDGLENRVYLSNGLNVREMENAVGNAIMLLYARVGADRDTMLIHSSTVVDSEGYAYAFLGKSGTGKSTHSRLWLENISGTHLLNDDNPVVKLLGDGSVRIYGSPWSGKTPCYRNESAPLRAIVSLRQAPNNKIRRLTEMESYAAYLPSCSCVRWRPELEDALSDDVVLCVSSVPCFRLECLPDADAAYVCNKAVTEK